MFSNRVSTCAIWMNVSWEYWGRRTLGTSLTASTWRKTFNQEMTVTGQSSHFNACQRNLKCPLITTYILPTINQYQYFTALTFSMLRLKHQFWLFKNLFKIIFISGIGTCCDLHMEVRGQLTSCMSPRNQNVVMPPWQWNAFNLLSWLFVISEVHS